MPHCNSQAMELHLAEISSQVAPGAHAVLMLDQAGWHMSGALVVPANITLLPLPPKCPELNPVEAPANPIHDPSCRMDNAALCGYAPPGRYQSMS